MKVTKLHIDEYKVFKDFDIDFTDREGIAQNLIVLAGINGTGKTTLLKFIFNVVNSRSQNITRTSNFAVIANYSFSDFNHIFYDSREDGVYLYYNQDIEADYENFKNGVLFFRVKQFNLSYSLKPISDNNVIIKFIDNCIYEEKMPPQMAYKTLTDYLHKLIGEFSIDFQFSRLNRNKDAIFINGQNKEIKIEDLSTGERQILSILLQLVVANIKNSLILIDEPEFSLHPSWQNKIVGVLKKYADQYNCQVILATHSPHIIGSVHPEQLRLLYKDENGAIKVRGHVDGSYGWTADKVLIELMDIGQLRTPDVARIINELIDLIHKDEFESDVFKTKFKEAENLIGYSDSDLVRMRFEIAKRKKESAANH